MPSRARRRRLVDGRAIEAARRANQRASWERLKAATAAKYEEQGENL